MVPRGKSAFAGFRSGKFCASDGILRGPRANLWVMANFDKTRFLVKPGKKIRLSEFDPADTSLMPDKDEVEVEIQKDLEEMTKLQDRFYAEHQRALLVVLQGMDTSGKDGTIKH